MQKEVRVAMVASFGKTVWLLEKVWESSLAQYIGLRLGKD